MSWHRIRVYHHDDPDGLVRNALAPLWPRLAGPADAAYYTRHWLHGTHLRIDVRTGTDDFERRVIPLVRDEIGGHLARHPSTGRPDPAETLPLHRRLAELEGVAGPLTPWWPDNTVQVSGEPWESETVADELLAGFYTDTTGLAFAMTEPPMNARFGPAFDLMTATAAALSGMGITRASLSFRSHAEAFLNTFPEGAGLRPAWERHYRRNADLLARRFDRVLATLGPAADAAPFVREWIARLGPYRDRAAAAVEEARLGVLDVDGVPALAQGSEFHRRLIADPEWHRLRRTTGFLAYRVLINYTYLHFTRLGIAPAERFLLCFLAARTAEEHAAARSAGRSEAAASDEAGGVSERTR